MSVANSSRLHFPGLNTLRFYAALSVAFEHIDYQIAPKPLYYKVLNRLMLDAPSAVNLFFVLSGFLITYLLLHEQSSTGSVSVGKFYLRRALRIWPPYYVVTTLGLVLFPLWFGAEYPLFDLPAYKIVLAFSLLPNFAPISAPMVHIWSIGVEEQFYALWPWIARKRVIVPASAGILILKLALVLIVPLFKIKGMTAILTNLRFECMALGALAAYAYFVKASILKWLYHRVTQILAWGACAYVIIGAVPTNFFYITGFSLAFAVVILNVATNPNSLVKLEYRSLGQMGKISYGFYLYHFPVIYLIYQVFHSLSLVETPLFPHLFLVVSLLFTWLAATSSYRWLERPFLELKERLAIVRSSD